MELKAHFDQPNCDYTDKENQREGERERRRDRQSTRPEGRQLMSL